MVSNPNRNYRLDEPVLAFVMMVLGLYVGFFHTHLYSNADWRQAIILLGLGLAMVLLGFRQLVSAWFGTVQARRADALAGYLVWGAFNAVLIVTQGWSLTAATYLGYVCAQAGIYLGYRTERTLPAWALVLWGGTLLEKAGGVPQPMAELAPAWMWGGALALIGFYGYWCQYQAGRERYASGLVLIAWLFITAGCLLDQPFCWDAGGVFLLVCLLGLTALAAVVHVLTLLRYRHVSD